MTIANENNRIDITATGGQTTFAYNFKIEAEDEIAVYLTPNGSTPSDATDILTLTTDYTLTGVDADGGGNIVLTAGSYPSGATAGDVLVAVRAIDFDQPDSYVVGQDHAENLEASLDRMAMRIQRLEEMLGRAYMEGVTGENAQVVIPPAGADEFLKWNAAGTALETSTVLEIAVNEIKAATTQVYSATPEFDLTAYFLNEFGTLEGNITDMTTSGRIAGGSVDIVFTGHATNDYTIALNSSWTVLGTPPATLQATKKAILSLRCTGTAETDVIAIWGKEF